MTGIWTSVGIGLDAPCLWLSLIAVFDMALMLHVTGIRKGSLRFVGIVSGTALILIGSQWLIAANAFGMALGLLPMESMQQVGSVLVWEFSRLRISQEELVYLPLSLLLAWYTGLHRAK